jgi:hypothetical protein
MDEHQIGMNEVEGHGRERGRAGRGSKAFDRLEELRALPDRFKERAEANPRGALVVVGAVAFVMGGLVASRLGRFALAAAIPVVIGRALDDLWGEKPGGHRRADEAFAS